MQVDLTFRHTKEESHSSTRQFIEQQVEKHLKTKLERFNVAQLRLHATIELHKDRYNVTFRLHLPPKKVLVTHASDEHLRPAVEAVLSKLTRQLEKHFAHISGREKWHRETHQKQRVALEALEALQQEVNHQEAKKKAPDPSTDESTDEIELEELLPRLSAYIKHEMTYLRANGDIQGSYPRVADILDDVYLKAQQQWDTLPQTKDELYLALLKIVTDIFQQQVAYQQLHETDISLEDTPLEDAQQQAEDMVEEDIQEFYQPDEVLHIEDLIPSQESIAPEQQLELQAIDSCYRLLGSMPRLWRQVVILVYREQIDVVMVAETIIILPVDEIKETLAKAEAFISSHLEEQGLAEWSDLNALLKPQ